MTLTALEKLGTRRAVCLSALVFALMHGQIGALPAHLALGLILGWLMVRCGTLWAPMLFHAVYNGGTMLAAYLAQGARSVAEPAESVPLVTDLPYLLIMLAALGGLVALLLIRAARAAAKENPPPRFEPLPGVRLSAGARVLLGTLLALFALQYVANIFYYLGQGGAVA
jgi:membrane protease YdiL (CAAX protease family)